jgi:2-dehydropantoate 2-reductase
MDPGAREPNMKISVLGAGAIGSMFGGLLKQRHPDWEVVLVTRGAHAAAIRDQGYVELIGPWGVHRPPVHATENVADVAGSSHVLLTVKSQDTRPVLEAARPCLGDAIVTSIQNGVNRPVLAEYVAPERLALGTTVLNIATIRPGAVALQIDGVTAVGPADSGGPSANARDAAELLARSGLNVQYSEQILGMQYNKLVINCLGCAASVSDLNFVREGIFDRQWRQAVAWPLYRECLATIAAAGIELAPIAASSDVTRFGRLLRSLDRPGVGAAIRYAERLFVRRKPTKFSVRQDLDRRRPTEVDFINGEIVRLAGACGRPAPLNALVVELVRDLERSSGRSIPREEIVRRFRSP